MAFVEISSTCELEEGEISDETSDVRDDRHVRPNAYGSRPRPLEVRPRSNVGVAKYAMGSDRSRTSQHASSHPYLRKPQFGQPRCNQSWSSARSSRQGNRGSTPPSRSEVPPYSQRNRTSQNSIPVVSRERRTSQLEHYSWFRRTSDASRNSGSHSRTTTSTRTISESSPSVAGKNSSQPKFLQQLPITEPSYEDLLAQYRTIQTQLESLEKKHQDEGKKNAVKSECKKAKTKKHHHTPKCKKARKLSQQGSNRKSTLTKLRKKGNSHFTSSASNKAADDKENTSVEHEVQNHATQLENAKEVINELALSDVSDAFEEDESLLELRRKALESRKNAQQEKVQAETVEMEKKDGSSSASPLLMVLDELPAELLEADSPIAEVQHKQQLRKGAKMPWFDKELTQLMRSKDRAYSKWKRHPCYENWEAFKAIKKTYLQMLKRKRTAYTTTSDTARAKSDSTQSHSAESEKVTQSPEGTGLPLENIPLPNGQASPLEDNYDTVEMEVDSDGVLSSPTLEVLEQEDSSDAEDEEALRAQLLQSLKHKRETQPVKDSEPKKQTNDAPAPRLCTKDTQCKQKEKAKLAVKMIDTKKATPVVISLGVDDTTSEEESDKEENGVVTPAQSSEFSAGLEKFLKEARQKAQVPQNAADAPHSTPLSVLKLSQAQQLEYRRLKAEIARREQRSLKQLGSGCQQLSKARKIKMRIAALKALQNTLHAERKAYQLEDKQMKTLRKEVLTRKTAVRGTEVRIQRLKAQLATMEKAVNGHAAEIRRSNAQLQLLQATVDKRKSNIAELEKQCQVQGKAVYGDAYKLPDTESATGLPVSRRKNSIGSLAHAQKTRATEPSAPRSSTEILSEKIRLQKLEQELRQRLQELKQGSGAAQDQGVLSKPIQSKMADATRTRVGTPTPITSEAQSCTSASTSATSIGLRKEGMCDRSEAKVKADNEELQREGTLSEVTRAIQAVYSEHCARCLESKMEKREKSRFLPVSDFVVPNGPLLNKLKVNLLRRPSDYIPPTAEIHPIDLKSYVSPLLHFRSYRLNPNFLKVPGQSLDSQSFCHKLQCRAHLCRYELHGTCNDDRCIWQHQRNYSCSSHEILIDLALYSRELLGASPEDSPQQCLAKAEKYVADLKRKHKGLSLRLLCKLVVTDVNRSLKNVSPYYVQLSKRPCILQQLVQTPATCKPAETLDSETQSASETKDWKSMLQQKVDRQDPELLELESDVRYFDTAVQAGIPALEALVQAEPQSEELWLRLAYRHLHNNQSTSEECLEQALNVFSQALENNRSSPEIWRHYLSWYSVHPDSTDLDYLCRRALEYCPHNSVWWKCVTLVEGVETKGQLCQQQLYQLTQEVTQDNEQEAGSYSAWVLEILLYWVHLNIVSGRIALAFSILKASVKSVIGFKYFGAENGDVDSASLDSAVHDIIQCATMLLIPGDLCVLWLCYIYFVEFRSLPEFLFSAERGSLGRLCRKDCFEIDWSEKKELLQSPSALICAFQEAVDELGGPERCTSLFASWLALQVSQDMGADAILLCSSAVEENPSWAEGWLQLFNLHQALENKEDATRALEDGLMHNPSDAKLVFHAAKHKIIKKDFVSYELLEGFVKDHFELESEISSRARIETDDHVGFPKLQNCDDTSSIYAYLNYIEFMKTKGAPTKDIKELYEALVTMSNVTNNLQVAWWNYLTFHLETLVVPSSDASAPIRVSLSALKSLTALVHRCLLGVPSHRPLPTESRQSWTDFEFADRVLNMLAAHVMDPQDRAELLASYVVDMPRNYALAKRVVGLYLSAGDRHTARTFLKTVMNPGVVCFHLWELAIQLAILEDDHYEVHRLFESAVQALPHHIDLWNHLVMYELSQGHFKHAQKAAETAAKYQLLEVQQVFDSLVSKELSQDEVLERLKIHLLPM